MGKRSQKAREQGRGQQPLYSVSGIPGCRQVIVGQSLDRMLTPSLSNLLLPGCPPCPQAFRHSQSSVSNWGPRIQSHPLGDVSDSNHNSRLTSANPDMENQPSRRKPPGAFLPLQINKTESLERLRKVQLYQPCPAPLCPALPCLWPSGVGTCRMWG